MWAIEREEREGLEERQLCQQQGRCSGMDLTRGVWKKKSRYSRYTPIFIPPRHRWLRTISVTSTSTNIYSSILIVKWIRINDEFSGASCLHKIIVQPLAVFRQSPSPFTSFEGMEHCRVTLDERGTKTTRGNSRRESVRESEGSPSLFGSQRPFDFSVD